MSATTNVPEKIPVALFFATTTLAVFWTAFAAPAASQSSALHAVIASLLVFAALCLSFLHVHRLDAAGRACAESEAHARRKSRQLELTLEHIGQGIIMVDAAGEIVVANDKALALMNIPAPGRGRRNYFDKVIDIMQERGEFRALGIIERQATMRRIRTLDPALQQDYYERKRPDGTVLAVHSRRTPDGGFVRTITDITEHHRSVEKIAHLARHDTLTNLANRAEFHEALDAALKALAKARTLRQPDDGGPASLLHAAAGFSVMLIDLDKFKTINDTHGHAVGDALLRQAALRLEAAVRTEDIVARLGGDEFAIVMIGLSDPKLVTARAKHLVERLGEPFVIDGLRLISSASVGCATAPVDGTTANDLTRNAALALGSAKAAGRNTCRLFAPEMSAAMIKRQRIEHELSSVIANRELELHYQPLMNIKTRELSGFEALLRWNHPERGQIPPLEFIPVAEDTGAIIAIGRWVLEEACREAATWPPGLKLAVNLSPIQFREPLLLDDIKLALQRAGLDPARLELEITETVMMHSAEQTVAKLEAINALGIKISMDDFGTGYSSLNYLRNFAFDKIKIDRSFIGELGRSNESDSIVRAIISLAACLDVATTAEGVETEQQLAALSEMGCEEAQGYLFSPPRPASELAQFFAPRGPSRSASAA